MSKEPTGSTLKLISISTIWLSLISENDQRPAYDLTRNVWLGRISPNDIIELLIDSKCIIYSLLILCPVMILEQRHRIVHSSKISFQDIYNISFYFLTERFLVKNRINGTSHNRKTFTLQMWCAMTNKGISLAWHT